MAEVEYPSMAPDEHEMEEARAKISPPPDTETPKVQPEYDTPEDAPMLDVDDFDYSKLIPSEAKPVEPEEKPLPEYDASGAGQEITNRLREEAKAQTQREWMMLAGEMQQIDNFLASAPRDEEGMMNLSDQQRQQLAAAQGRKVQLQDQMNRVLPTAHQLRESQAALRGDQIISTLEREAQKYPEYADKIIEVAKNLPEDALGKPETYRRIVQMVIGETEMERRQQESRNRAAGMASVGGGRGGATNAPVREVSRQEIDKFRRLGLKGDALNRAVQSLQKNG